MTGRDVLARSMSEAELQSAVIARARALGWRWYHTHDSRRSPGGFPDLVLVNAARGRLIFAELKREGGRFRPGQEEWLSDLRRAHGGVYVWRPSDLLIGEIDRVLTR